jgi:hypothetical protein
MTGYLLWRKKLDGGSDDGNEIVLYETKVFVPFAWSLLFGEDDLKKVGDDTVLTAQPPPALERARTRLAKLEPLLTAELRDVLAGFVESVAARQDGWLVLDPYRIEMSDLELITPARWFDSPDPRTAAAVFADDDGVDLDDDGLLDVGDDERVAGWPITETSPPERPTVELAP